MQLVTEVIELFIYIIVIAFSKILFKIHLKLDVVDTIPPVIKVQNISKALNCQIDVNDFIVDNPENAEIESDFSVDTSKYGEYDVNIIAKDKFGNTTKETAKLNISWVKKELQIELGNVLTKEMLVYDKKDTFTIKDEDIEKINHQGLGDYQVISEKDGVQQIITITKMQDKTPPVLVLKNVKTYVNKKISKNDFISKVSDNYSKVTTTLLTKINNEIGKQVIKIKAIDEAGNEIIKEATLEIIKDTKGPVFNGLGKIVVNKGETINYEKGVKAVDENYGTCEFEYKSEVDINKYGTYYVYYTACDKEGNKTTQKRVVVVNHDENDTKAIIEKTAETLSNDVIEIRNYVRKIKYTTNNGGSDPTWQGLVNRSGNCIVHAYTFDALLKAKGYETKIIWVTNKSHYWNLIYLNGKWVHMDSTPGVRHTVYDIMNDKMRYETLQGRNWERSKWPKAEWDSL